MKKIYIDSSIEVLVCSYGGTGTTMLIRFLSDYFRCNSADDEDGLKHTDRIPVSRNRNLKIIYMYCDPVDAVYSLFRRGFFSLHSRKLLRSQRQISPVSDSGSLQLYADELVDRFQFENHFRNWKCREQFFPVLFIRFESLWEHLPLLFEFLGIPVVDVGRFPEKRQRSVETMVVNDRTRSGIQQLYGEFQNRLKEYPDIITVLPRREPGCTTDEWIGGLPGYWVFHIRKIIKRVLPLGVIAFFQHRRTR